MQGDEFAGSLFAREARLDKTGATKGFLAAYDEQQRKSALEDERAMRIAIVQGERIADADHASRRKAALEDERSLRHAIAEGEKVADDDVAARKAGLSKAQLETNKELMAQGEANEPSREEMQVARRQAAVNDFQRAAERARQASLQADLARTGPGRMGVMQRQQIMRQYKAMGNMRRGTGGGRMGIMQRQLAAKAGFGGDRERLAVDAVQKQYDTTKELKEAVELLRSEGIQAYL
jgi:hypothetical protein